MAATLLLALGGALVLVAMTETAIAANTLRGSESLSLAEAALARAVADLDQLPDWSDALAGTATSAFTDGGRGGVRRVGGTVVDLTALGVVFDSQGSAQPFGSNNPKWQLYAWGPADRLLGGGAPPAYLTVWVADDPGERDGDPLRDGGDGDHTGSGVVLVTAAAWGPGGARRVVEAIIRRPVGRPAQIEGWHRVR